MASPTPDHVLRAQDEDIMFLVQHGASLEEAVRRVGINLKTYEKRHSPSRTNRTEQPR